MIPRLSVIIPTVDPERPLRRTIDSTVNQLVKGDEIIVVGDTCSGPLPEIERLCHQYRPTVRYVPFGDERCYGHPQIDHGVSIARGDWLVFQDDDDIFTPGAFEAIRHQIGKLKKPAPLLFRYVTHYGLILWDGRKIEQGWIGGHSLVCPNISGMVAPRGRRYEGDFDMVKGTCELWRTQGVKPVWAEDIISIARPTDAMVRHLGLRSMIHSAV